MNKLEYIVKLISISSLIFYGSYSEAQAAGTAELPVKTNLEIADLEAIDLGSKDLTIPKTVAEVAQARANGAATLLAQADPVVLDELDKLAPNPDDLAIPTTTEEVTIDLKEPITLEQAIQLALTNNRDRKEAVLSLDRAHKELRQARAALYPTLALGANLQNSDNAANNRQEELFNGAASIDSTTGESTTTFNGDLTLSYNVFNGGARGADIRRAKKVVEFNELDVARITEDVTFETKNNYYSLQDSESQVRIQESAVDDAEQTLKDARLLEQAGLGTRFDVLRAEVELANAQQNLITAFANRDSARRQLVETLSLGQKVDIQTADEVTKRGTWDFSLEESIITAYGNRVELEQFLVNREINKEQKQVALGQIRPTVSVFGQLDALDNLDDDVDLTTGYTVGAQLRWTIFDGGSAQAIARQEDIDVAIVENDFANQQNLVRLEVEQAFFGLKANEQNIGTAEKAVDLAEESLRLARLRFQAGVGTQTDVIEAQTELTTARGNLLTAIINYNQSLNQLQRAVTGESEPAI